MTSITTDARVSPVAPPPSLDSLQHLSLALSEHRSIIAPTPQSNRGVVTAEVPPSPPLSTNDNGEVRVCALQPALRPPTQSPWDALVRVQRLMETIASNESVDLFVLPELSPIGYSEDTFARFLPIAPANQAMYQEFDRFFQIAARSLNVYICYGTIGWSFERRLDVSAHNGAPKLFIRQIVVDRLGTQVACYDKTYLCDYGSIAETRIFTPGPASHPTSFVVHCPNRISSFRFGLLICSDVRYPGLARRLAADADHRVDCILHPSATTRDCSLRTLASFQETRAVENSVYWIGVNYADRGFGASSIIPPFVDEENEPIKLGSEEGYVIGRVFRNTLDHVRRTLPFYQTLLLESGKSSHKD
jgi:predicted amidohydrolase